MTQTPTGITYTWRELRTETQKHQQDGVFEFLFKMLVPTEGPAATTAGETVRAFSRLSYRFYNDGDRCGGNASTGGDSVNSPWRYLRKVAGARSPQVSKLAETLGDLTYGSTGEYSETLQELGSAILELLQENPNMMTEKNEKDSVCGEEFEHPVDYKYDEDDWEEEEEEEEE